MLYVMSWHVMSCHVMSYHVLARVCAFLVDSFDTMFASYITAHRVQTQQTHDMSHVHDERDRIHAEHDVYKTRVAAEMDVLRQHVKEANERCEEMRVAKMRGEETEAQQSFTIKTLQQAADMSAQYQQQVRGTVMHVLSYTSA